MVKVMVCVCVGRGGLVTSPHISLLVITSATPPPPKKKAGWTPQPGQIRTLSSQHVKLPNPLTTTH